MANNFESNFTRKLMEKVLARVEMRRVISKEVDTQTFAGKFNGATGDTIDVQRPTRYKPLRTPEGDITGNKRDIVTGKASAVVQDYITVPVDYNEADEALKMGTNMNRFWDDMANDIVIELETNFAAFVGRNSALLSGTVGNGVNSWAEIANSGALLEATGAPKGNICYALNPFSQVAIANEQRSLGVNPEVANSNKMATVSENFAGMKVMTATGLPRVVSGAGADRAGVLAANPIVTYVAAKDTMTQQLSVSGFSANLEIKAGEVVEIAGRFRLDRATRLPVLDAQQNRITWTATVTTDATLDGSGAGTIIVTGPAIYEGADGAYNTVDAAPVSGDVVTLLGAESSVNQPDLFFHRDAFTIAFVQMEKLHNTDTIATTKDGLQMRVSKYSDGDANKQSVRIDLRPAYGVMNPFYAGLSYGNP